jgi:hypothetical protein
MESLGTCQFKTDLSELKSSDAAPFIVEEQANLLMIFCEIHGRDVNICDLTAYYHILS